MKNNAFKINKEGHLEIKRAGKFKLQSCPYKPEFHFCGDWCPLFYEPYMDISENKATVHLSICDNILKVSNNFFQDERNYANVQN